jgi:hypothetical protein
MSQTEILIYTILGAAGAAGIAYTLNKTHKGHKEHIKHKKHDDTYGKDFRSVTAAENSQNIKTNSDERDLREAEYALQKAEKELLKTKTPSARFKASEKVDQLQKEIITISSLKHRSKKGGSLNKKTRNKSRK